MTDDFDPYYTWLGIPPDEQPASHYRLLGVREMEPNLDVISNAGDQRMAFLRTFQVGKRSALSQRLLNEMAAAKVCLLDPDRRKAYDEKLKASQPKPVAPAPLVAPVYSPPAPASTPPRPAPVVRPLPVATRLPSVPDPFALVDPFADAAREVQVQPKLRAKPRPGGSGDYTQQLQALARAAVRQVQELSPLAAGAYGVLALGVLMLLSVALWIGFGGNRQSPQVAIVPAANAASTPSTPPTADKGSAPVVPAGRTKLDEKETPADPAPPPIVSPSPTPAVPSKSEPTKSAPAEKPAETNVAKSPPAAPSTASTVNPTVPPAETVPAPVPMPTRVANTPLWNVVLGKFPQPHKARLSTLSSKLVAFAVPAKEVKVWPVPANFGEKIADPQIINTQSNALCVCFSRNDKFLAVGTETTLEVKDLETKQQWRIGIPGKAVDVVFCDDDKLVAVACQGVQPLVIFSFKNGAFIKTPPSNLGEVRTLSSSDQWLAALGASGQISLYDLQQGIHHGVLVHQEKKPFTAVHMRGGDHLFVFDDRCMTGWSAQELKKVSEWSYLRTDPQPDDFDSHSGYFTQQQQGTLFAFNLNNEKPPLARIAAHEGRFAIVDIAHNRLLTNGPSDQLLIWNLDTLKDFPRKLDPAQEIAALTGKPVAPGSANTASSTVPQPSAESMTPAQAAARLRAIGVTIYTPDPKDADYVAFQNCKFTDDDIRCLAAFPRLKTVSFQNVAVTGQTLKCLQNCRGLQSINLPKSDLGDEDLAHLAPLTGLTSLGAMETKVTADCLESLAGLTNLELLMLPQSLGRELIPHLANYPKLKHFHPIPHNLTDKDMKVIGSLRRLEFLDLQTSKLSLEGYKHLANLTEARSVQLPNQLPPGAIGYLSKMKLEYVTFPESTTIDEMRLFQGMTTLRFVRVSKSVTDDGLQLIAGFKSVENVALTDASLVTPAGMSHLATMKTLKSVTIPHHMGDEGLARITDCKSLVELSMDDTTRITNAGLKNLGSLPILERLRLPRSLDDQGLEAVAECRNLKGLSIRQSAVTAKGFQKLQVLKKLEELNLSSLKLTAEQVDILKSMTNLKSLTLVQCTLPSGDGSDLKSALPNVRVNIY